MLCYQNCAQVDLVSKSDKVDDITNLVLVRSLNPEENKCLNETKNDRAEENNDA